MLTRRDVNDCVSVMTIDEIPTTNLKITSTRQIRIVRTQCRNTNPICYAKQEIYILYCKY